MMTQDSLLWLMFIYWLLVCVVLAYGAVVGWWEAPAYECHWRYVWLPNPWQDGPTRFTVLECEGGQ